MKIDIAKYSGSTPAMQQYLEVKEKYKDYLIFYRMGDFYEMFYEDAQKASRTLDITLTKRGKNDGEDIPMCGVPVHSHESYLNKLIKNGYKVAICEQTETVDEAKKRAGAKAVINRAVTRIITPGTITEENLLEATNSNYLLSISVIKDILGLAWADISTGEFFVSRSDAENLYNDIAKIRPKEILISELILETHNLKWLQGEFRSILTPHVKSFFEFNKGERKLKEYFELETLEALGKISPVEKGAAGALLEYIQITQVGKKPKLGFPKKLDRQEFMEVDASSMNNLEILKTQSGQYKGSLFSIINKTQNPSGARLLFSYLNSPLLDVDAINMRLNCVEFFVEQREIRKILRDYFRKVPDVERILSRIFINRTNPRDIAGLRDGMEHMLKIQELFVFKKFQGLPSEILDALVDLGNHDQLYSVLKEALYEFPNFNLNEGAVIKDGFDPRLDEYRNIKENSEELRSNLEEKYRNLTGVDRLKIKDNNVLGMFIEVTPQYVSKIPAEFIHRQTLANAVRYTTQELREIENKIVNAKGYAIQLEVEIFNNLKQKIIESYDSLIKSANAIAKLDVFTNFAEIAENNNYSRPTIDDTQNFSIKGGRHPIVEKSNAARENVTTINDFIANDCELTNKRNLWLVTGPNMSGKSTFLRQNALIAIMAQIGCYVPAESAHIGLVDRIFSRVGAADDLARGQSTFMVEMVETANILNNATDKSLVILDEIGRGTATYDGLSIAWAVVEYLHDNNRCRTLFATHYHELTSLKSNLARLACHTVEVKEWNGDVIFMHKVLPGIANQSYGIHVAKIAGLPREAVSRAREILDIIQLANRGNSFEVDSNSLPLFARDSKNDGAAPDIDFSEYEADYAATSVEPQIEKEVELSDEEKLNLEQLKLIKEIKNLDLNTLTPKTALDFLFSLKERI
jgi:DNA mismatch repair protein MutS